MCWPRSNLSDLYKRLKRPGMAPGLYNFCGWCHRWASIISSDSASLFFSSCSKTLHSYIGAIYYYRSLIGEKTLQSSFYSLLIWRHFRPCPDHSQPRGKKQHNDSRPGIPARNQGCSRANKERTEVS